MNDGSNKWVVGSMLVGLVLFVWWLAKDSDNKEVPTTAPTNVATDLAHPTEAQIVYCGEEFAKRAIKAVCKDPESVRFFEKGFENYYPVPQEFVCRWRVTGTNGYGGRVQGVGVAHLKYNGGDVTKWANWELVSAEIKE